MVCGICGKTMRFVRSESVIYRDPNEFFRENQEKRKYINITFFKCFCGNKFTEGEIEKDEV